MGSDQNADRKLEGTIAFATVGRAHYAFDVFALALPNWVPGQSIDPDALRETQLSDGVSVNFNGQLVDGEDKQHVLQWMQNAEVSTTETFEDDGELLLHVSERDGSARIYFTLHLHNDHSPTKDRVEKAAEILKTTRSDECSAKVGEGQYLLKQKESSELLKWDPSKSVGPHLHDRPQISGRRIVYVSTEQDPRELRQSWAAVYSANLDSLLSVRLTPEGVSDFSPAISLSGEWVAAASFQDKGWQGEFHDLHTDIYVFSAVDGSKRKLLVKDGGWPCWKDDSTLFFHRKAEDGWWSIFKVVWPGELNLDLELKSEEERITPPGVHSFTPAASKLGDWIAVATRRQEHDFRHVEIYDLKTRTFIELTRKLAPTSHHYNPSISASSEHISYHRCNGANRGTAPIPRLESLQSPIPGLSLLRVDGAFPTFSPDGTLIAYVTQNFEKVYVTRLDGSVKWQIYSQGIFGIAWDRKRKGVVYLSSGIIFESERTEVHVLSVHNADDALGPYPTKQLTKNGTGNNAFPSPSPEGDRLVFRSGRDGRKNLYVMDAVDGEDSELYRLTNGDWTDTMPSWSPTGEWIAFSSDRDLRGRFAAFLIRPDGTDLRRVLGAPGVGLVNHACFSPDGKSLVFASDFAAVSAEPVSVPLQFQPYGELYVSRMDGTEIVRLTHNGYEDGTPAWGPKTAEVSNIGREEGSWDFKDVLWLNKPVSSRC